MGSREVARELGMEHTRVSRLLGTLAALGLAAKTPGRKYQAGPGLHVLAAQSLKGSRLLACALPQLRRLLKANAPVALGVLWRRHVCYLFFGRPGQPFEEGLGASAPYPAEQSSIGLVLLAALSDTEVRRRMRAGPAPLPKQALDELLRQLKRVRKLGYALVERAGGERTLAVAIASPPVAGLAFAGALARGRLPGLRANLLACARTIAAGLKH